MDVIPNIDKLATLWSYQSMIAIRVLFRWNELPSSSSKIVARRCDVSRDQLNMMKYFREWLIRC